MNDLLAQEYVATTWAMANMNNMIIHDMEGQIEIGDTFKNPKFRAGNKLQTFDRVVSNPMWNQDWFNGHIRNSIFRYGHKCLVAAGITETGSDTLKGPSIMRSDIVPGALFPDYELTDHTAKRRKLSELQGQHPMVLVLSRGGYCPKDRRHSELLVQLHRELEVGYCRLVTISTDNITLTNEYRSGVGAHWPFLSDTRRSVQKDLDIAEYTDPDHDPMIPHVIVLEPGLVIYKIYNGYWFFGRPTLEDLRQDLRAVTQKCRPDWDITTPEMKAAWKEGRKELFYPYGKTYAQTLGEQD